jgi:tetratricopeptide (TPR) repeat protein
LSKVLAQAVQSGKNAISTYPPKVNNWENLAGIYRAMIGSVKDADLWTVQAYQQAVRLDPMNPNIRLALGGVYYGAKNYDVAIEYFTQAANLKPNLANAYYNLSASYREKKDWERASQAMQRVIQIVPTSSEDRKKAESELEEIKKNIPAPSNAPQGKELINEGKTGSQIETPVDVPGNVAPTDVIKETPRPSSSPSTR